MTGCRVELVGKMHLEEVSIEKMKCEVEGGCDGMGERIWVAAMVLLQSFGLAYLDNEWEW